MKKTTLIVFMAMVLSSVSILSSAAEGTTWVMMHGRVERYGANTAFGWCMVYAKVEEWARACVAWMPSGGPPTIPEILNFHAAELNETTLVKLNYNGADLYILGLWNVYNITFIFEPGTKPGNYTLTIKKWIDRGEGTLSVTGNWEDFTVSIRGIPELGGTVIHHVVSPAEPIPIGDVSGPMPGIPDNTIDICDLVHAAQAYESIPMPGIEFMNFGFFMDFNFDFKIDICDLTTIAANLGKSY